MNNPRDLSKRLLRLYPVNLLREEFEESGTANDIIETVTGNVAQGRIKDFARLNFSLTKQHVHIFELDGNFNRGYLDFDEFPMTIEHEEVVAGEYRLFCLPRVTYDVILSNPLETEQLRFLQPVLIRISNRQVIVHYTILEKNIRHFYDPNRNAIRQSQQDHEAESIVQLTAFFQGAYNIQPTDLNAGIKYLWEQDWIDSKHVKFRKNRSMSSEVMDEDYTLKDEYPNVYAELLNSPLEKTIFKYLRDDDFLCDHFSVDPTLGVIKISIFPEHTQQVTNVVQSILQNN